MLKRLFVVLVTLAIILTAGWWMLRRDDISYTTLESVYSKSNSRFLKSGKDVEIHFTDSGPRDAPVVVLVHGYSASLQTWDACGAETSQGLPGHPSGPSGAWLVSLP